METDPNADVSVADDIVPNVEEAVANTVVRAILGCPTSSSSRLRDRRGTLDRGGGDTANNNEKNHNEITTTATATATATAATNSGKRIKQSTATVVVRARTSKGNQLRHSNDRILEGTMLGLSSKPADVVDSGCKYTKFCCSVQNVTHHNFDSFSTFTCSSFPLHLPFLFRLLPFFSEKSM